MNEISPSVPVIKTSYADIPLEMLTEIRRPNATEDGQLGDGRPDPLMSITLKETGGFSQNSWQEFRSDLPGEIMRAKGFVKIDDQRYFVETTMDDWRMHKIDNVNASTNDLVIIGRKLDEEHIAELFKKKILKQ